MASIRARNGKWQARINRMGTRPIEKTFLQKATAIRWAHQVESDLERGLYVDRAEAERHRFCDLLERYRDEILSTKRGRAVEAVRLSALARSALGGYSMAALNSRTIAEWRDDRLKAVSGSTVNRELNIISAVINVAIREWGFSLPCNPVALVKRPAVGPPRDRRLEPGEEQALLAALGVSVRDSQGHFTGPQNPWMVPLVQFALETAMRRGELLGLRWEDVDTAKRIAHLVRTKNGQSRWVPLSSRALDILAGLPHLTDDRVFPLTANAVKKAFSRACTREALHGVVFHTLRHEATSRLAEKLPNVIELAAVTGHRDLRMLQRYYHPRAQELALKLG